MEFLQEPLAVSLAEDARGEYTSFSAELFSPRPPFKEIQAFQEWGKELQESIVTAMQRKNCPIKWLGVFIDTGGAASQSPGRLAKAHAAAWADEPPGTPPRLSAGIGCPTAVASAAVGCWQTSRAKKRITAPAAGKASTHCA